MQTDHVQDRTLGGYSIDIGPAVRRRAGLNLPGREGQVVDDHDYVRDSWLSSAFRARGVPRMPAEVWIGRSRPVVEQVLAAPTTRVLVATNAEGLTIGWLVWTPSRVLPAVHYVYVRHKLGDRRCRRQRVATELLARADLGTAIAFTSQGEYRRGGQWKREHWPRPLGEELAARLRGTRLPAIEDADQSPRPAPPLLDATMRVVYEPLERWLG